MKIITADEGNVFRRNHDGVIFGETIYLGYDYSTGECRIDLPEYYEQIPEPDHPDEILKEGIL